MQHDLVLEGKVVKTTGIEELQVGVSEGRVAEIRKQGVKGERTIDVGRSLIFPGFIDIHVHLREPGWEYKEDFRTGTEAAVHGGVTRVVDMPNNPKPATTAERVREKTRLSKSKAVVQTYFLGGVDGEDLSLIGGMRDMVVGYKIYLSRTTGSSPFQQDLLGGAFQTIQKTGHPVSVHCEDQAVLDAASGVQGRGATSLAPSSRRPPQAEVAAVKKVVAAMNGVGGLRVNVCHASTKETLELVYGARMEGMTIECEATLHHLYFNDKSLQRDPKLMTNPPIRSEEDREGLVRGLKDGRVSFLVTDHAPHTLEDKATDGPSGVPGLDDYAHVVSWLVRKEGVEPSTIARVASANPAGFAGLSDAGEILVGKAADFSVLDLNSPERVEEDGLKTRCGWSPYEGREFPGRARWTVAKGEVLMDDGELAF